MAAESMALMTLLQQGDHVVAAGALYGGSVTMLAVNLARSASDHVCRCHPTRGLCRRDAPQHPRVFAESLGNPSLACSTSPRWPKWRMPTACR
jgi:O-acetylhomoserine (thiol)-lyase